MLNEAGKIMAPVRGLGLQEVPSVDLPDTPTPTLPHPFEGSLKLCGLCTSPSRYHLNNSNNTLITQTRVWK